MSGKQFLYLLIATLITVLIWLGMEVIRARSKTQISPEVEQLLEPVNPNFDQNLINDL